jgi:hypothetical protein
MEWRPGLLSDARQRSFHSQRRPKEALRLTLGEKSGIVAGRNFSDAVYFQNTEFMIYVFLLDGPVGLAGGGWMGKAKGKALATLRAQPGTRVKAKGNFLFVSAVTI